MAVYLYGPGRGYAELERLLVVDGKHFSGEAMTDGFNVYDLYEYFSGHAGCLAHAKRYISDAMKVQSRLDREFHSRFTSNERRKEILKENPVFREQLWLLEKIGQLTDWEHKLKDAEAEPDTIKKVRETKELPVLNEIHAKILELEQKFMPSGKFSIVMLKFT